jgi:hypothetical protein
MDFGTPNSEDSSMSSPPPNCGTVRIGSPTEYVRKSISAWRSALAQAIAGALLFASSILLEMVAWRQSMREPNRTRAYGTSGTGSTC